MRACAAGSIGRGAPLMSPDDRLKALVSSFTSLRPPPDAPGRAGSHERRKEQATSARDRGDGAFCGAKSRRRREPSLALAGGHEPTERTVAPIPRRRPTELRE